ncbi:hypothetical protein EIJ21_14015 [Xanthomonas perforans]|nr:hypothetical protein EIJ21_14015 [Xanthomonas perforans]
MAAANYNKPKPIDPIWYRQGCFIRIRCACGRDHVQQLGDFAKARGVSPNMQLYELIARLRCSACGSKPSAEVTRHRNGR